jgi:hypothetical protein
MKQTSAYAGSLASPVTLHLCSPFHNRKEEALVTYSFHLVDDTFFVAKAVYLPETSGAARPFIFLDSRSWGLTGLQKRKQIAYTNRQDESNMRLILADAAALRERLARSRRPSGDAHEGTRARSSGKRRHCAKSIGLAPRGSGSELRDQ